MIAEHPVSDGDGTIRRRAIVPCAAATFRELLQTMHATGNFVGCDGAPAVPVWRTVPGAVLLHEGRSSGQVFVVRSGMFKILKTSEDGYEQVLAFAGPGDILAFEGLSGVQRRVISLDDSSVFVLPLRDLDGWQQRYPGLRSALLCSLSRQLARAGDMTEIMAAVAAEVRLARFLLWQSSRMTECGQSSLRLRLRMSRRDIASLLGVACATVSRSFTALHQMGYLRVSNREIEIVDAAGLLSLARNTRGLGELASSDAPAASLLRRRRAAGGLNRGRPPMARAQPALAAVA